MMMFNLNLCISPSCAELRLPCESLICFLAGLEAAESLQGGLRLLASAQVLSGLIEGALAARPL